MKLFAFTDVHEHPKAMREVRQRIKKTNPDLIICCGDLTIFEHNISHMMNWLASLQKEVFIIHGNHETASRLKQYCTANIKFIHRTCILRENIVFAGWGGGGFGVVEPEFERFVNHAKPQFENKRVVLVTHAPPFGTKLDFLGKNWGYVGCKSITRFLKTNKNVVLTLSGHIHETFGKKDKVGNAIVVNPGPFGVLIEI